MKVSSLVILGVLLLGVGYVGVFKRHWFDKGRQYATGFTPAATPAEALNRFREAIQKREYKFAATYCTGPYAELLVSAHDGASSLGRTIDHVDHYMKDKGLQTDKSIRMLNLLDPFPANFAVSGVPKVAGDKASGTYVQEPLPLKNPTSNLGSEAKNLEPGMYQNVLMPYTMSKGIDLVKDGDSWKLNVAVPDEMPRAVGYFNDRWKTYHTTLGDFERYMTNGRYDSPEAFQTELLDALRKANPKS